MIHICEDYDAPLTDEELKLFEDNANAFFNSDGNIVIPENNLE